ncbi:hypothetical protein [Chitinophaga sp. MM2321]|uniref:hypothetical protein n=1 Tax=Chitinophaga sp. MM2321 TaxID=3137178 RepID=UPI0032D5B024
MWTSKKHICFAVITLLFCQCKPAANLFTYKGQINLAFFAQLPAGPGNNLAKIDSVKVYRAVLKEKLVERDEVPEYKLLNSKSAFDTVNYKVSKSYHYLYLFQVYSARYTLDTPWVYLGTSYRPDNTCTNVGPAYYGYLFMYQYNMKRELKVSRKNPQYQLVDKDTIDLNIVLDRVFKPEDGFIRVKQMILADKNKIGGTKPVIFTIPKIFNDPDALFFSYYNTIK